jgi:1-acyl-sn-glycerol-3-phosphate acyltransferase
LIQLRSALFFAGMILWTLLLSPGVPVFAVLPRDRMYRVAVFWARGILVLLRLVAGLDHRVVGRERLPDGPVVFATKHQSAWETIAFLVVGPPFSAILKRELQWIPLYGWFLAKIGMVPIDRKAGRRALKRMVARARKELARGRCIWVAPEGTRVPPGEARPYHSGIAAVYKELGVPVVPIALNSGVFWPRKSFRKWPGTITLEYLEPIPPGLPRPEFMALLQERIETASHQLAEEGYAQRRG